MMICKVQGTIVAENGSGWLVSAVVEAPAEDAAREAVLADLRERYEIRRHDLRVTGPHAVVRSLSVEPAL